jgi:adenylate kinase
LKIERSCDGFHLKITFLVESNTVEGHSMMTDHSIEIQHQAFEAARSIYEMFEGIVDTHAKQKATGEIR